MSKRPNISKEAEVLLKLLRIALGTEPRKYFGEVVEPFPEGIDWKEVVRLSYEHKVSAIAVDGLEASKYDPYKGLDEKQTEELKAVLEPWIKDVENTEWSYCYYVEVLKTLCQIFSDNGLTPIILKGYGLSLNYPRPSHRGAGDIDIYLLDANGKSAAEEGDRIARDVLGLEVSMCKSHVHSSFDFKGIHVENHHNLFDTRFKPKRFRIIQEELRKGLIENKVLSDQVSNAFFPDCNFNAEYLILHIQKHFLSEKINFRQLADWACFLQAYQEKIEWGTICDKWKQYGLDKFATLVNSAMIGAFGIKADMIPSNTIDMELGSFLIAENACRKWQKGTGLRKLLSYYKNRKYYALASYSNWIGLTLKSIYLHIFRREEIL